MQLTTNEWFNLIVPYLGLEDIARLRAVSKQFYVHKSLLSLELALKKKIFMTYPKQHWNRMGKPDIQTHQSIAHGITPYYATFYASGRSRMIAIFSSPLKMIQHFCNFINNNYEEIHNRIQSRNIAISICDKNITIFLNCGQIWMYSISRNLIKKYLYRVDHNRFVRHILDRIPY